MAKNKPSPQANIFDSALLAKKNNSNGVSIKPFVAAEKLPPRKTLQQKLVKPKPITKSRIDIIRQELIEINPNEEIIWIGRSSNLIHLAAYIICAVFCWLIIPIFVAYFLYLQTKNTIYVLTQERLRVYSGILTKRIDDLELYRVKDTAYTQPFIYRFFGLSNIQLFTSDASWRESYILGIEKGMQLREKIRVIVESAREKKGVKEVDYFARSGGPILRA